MVRLEMINTHEFGRKPDSNPTAATRDFLSHLLDFASYDGQWQVIAREQTSMNSNSRFKVRGLDGRAIKVRVKPGDGGSCWDWELFPPARLDAAEVAKDLERFNGWDGNDRKLAAAVPQSLPAEKRLTLSEKLAALEQAAAVHKTQRDKAAELRAKAVELLTQAEESDNAASAIEQELAADHEGRNAVAALAQLQKLFD